MIHLTERAARKMSEIAREEGIQPLVRAAVRGGGCAGFSHTLDFVEEEKLSEMDETIELDGVRVVVDAVSATYLDGATIDYEDGLRGAGFVFKNPNSTGSCGCGKSVTF